SSVPSNARERIVLRRWPAPDAAHRKPVRPAWLSRIGPSRLHHDLDAAVLLVAKRLVELRPLRERRAMRDHEGRIDLALLNPLEQLRQIALHRRLRHAESEPSV